MSVLKPKSTKALFTITAFVPVAALGTLIILFVSASISEWFEQDVERDIRAVATVLAAQIELAETLNSAEEMAQLNASLSAWPSIDRVLYVTKDGVLGRRWQFAREGVSGVSSVPQEAGPGELLRTFEVADLLGEQDRRGRIVFLVSTSRADERSRQAVWKMALLVLAAAALSGMAAWRFGRRLTHSVVGLQKAVEKVAQDRDYGARLPEFDLEDLSRLASGVQHLMHVVAEGNLELATQMRLSVSAASLAESERSRLATVMEAMPIGMALLSDSGHLSYFNPALCELFGVDESRLRGVSGGEFITALSCGSGAVEEGLNAAMGLGDGASPGGFVELTLGRDMSVTCTSVKIERGVREETLLLVRDVSSEHRAEKLEEGLRQAQQMESIGRLASAVSHDFNNILTAIVGFGQLALGATEADDPNKENIEEILAAADSAKLLTEKLLLLSQQRKSAPKVVDVVEVLKSQRGMLSQLLPSVSIKSSTDGGPFFVNIDPSELERVIVNIAVNAGDAMPKGGELRISAKRVVSSSQSDSSQEFVSVSFEDTGPGVPESYRERITEPFFTTKDLGAGTGLGLATVKSIVDRAGGLLEVESPPGAGARITVGLPLVAQPNPAAAPADLGGEVGESTSIFPGARVLLVEDSEMVRRVTSKLLQALGLDVVEAVNGPEALKALEEDSGQFDLLLTDIVMPGMRGRELASRVKAVRPDVEVLVMSGYDDEMIEPGAQQVDYPLLRKPFTREELTRAVRAALDSRG